MASRSTVTIGSPLRQETEAVVGELLQINVTVPTDTFGKAYSATLRLANGNAVGEFTTAVLSARQIQLRYDTTQLLPGRYFYDVASETEAGVVSISSLHEVLMLPGSNGGNSSDGPSAAGLVVTQLSGNAVAERGKLYYAQSPTLLLLQLPATVQPGDAFGFVNCGAMLRVTQFDGQQVQVGNLATTAGVQGKLESFTVGDWVELTYFSSNVGWVAKLLAGFIDVA